VTEHKWQDDITMNVL